MPDCGLELSKCSTVSGSRVINTLSSGTEGPMGRFGWPFLIHVHELPGAECQGGLSGHLIVNGQMYATRHTDYNVGTDQGPREPRVYRRTLTGLG